jgi:hypothetical protein
MRRLTVFAPTLLMAACSAEEPKHTRLMDQIESKVRMPAGSGPVSRYARYYAFDTKGGVSALYTTHVDPQWKSLDLPVGQRRWLSNEAHLPAISEGGCSVVEVQFNSASEQVERVECHERA